ncbi:MAG: diacylglycerol/lipid kinase family protein [Chitinophagaceae bacterium]
MNTIIAKNIAIFCNPLAGSGRAVKLAGMVAQELTKKKISYTLFKDAWPNDFNHFTDVFIAGGDGTLNYFINKYPGIKLPLVIFNGGTGNDFHWLLYADKSLDEQLQLALTQDPKPIDMGKCNDRYFINGVGIGFEGAVARALTGKKSGPVKHLFSLLF